MIGKVLSQEWDNRFVEMVTTMARTMPGSANQIDPGWITIPVSVYPDFIPIVSHPTPMEMPKPKVVKPRESDSTKRAIRLEDS